MAKDFGTLMIKLARDSILFLVNVVAMAPAGEWRTESWIAEGSVADLMREFEGWAGRVTQLPAAATETKRGARYARGPVGRWVQGRGAARGQAGRAGPGGPAKAWSRRA